MRPSDTCARSGSSSAALNDEYGHRDADELWTDQDGARPISGDELQAQVVSSRSGAYLDHVRPAHGAQTRPEEPRLDPIAASAERSQSHVIEAVENWWVLLSSSGSYRNDDAPNGEHREEPSSPGCAIDDRGRDDYGPSSRCEPEEERQASAKAGGDFELERLHPCLESTDRTQKLTVSDFASSEINPAASHFSPMACGPSMAMLPRMLEDDRRRAGWSVGCTSGMTPRWLPELLIDLEDEIGDIVRCAS